MNIHQKMLHYAGENYALAMLAFNGMPCAKMPEKRESYDLVVERNNTLERISVKTRSKTKVLVRIVGFP